MCGITGFWDQQQRFAHQVNTEIAQQMAEAIMTRGPDSCGVWQHPHNGLVFGHRRLSIVDLSPTGHQPMRSHSGRTVLAYNGEIYNTAELRQALQEEGITFRGTSDTEVIVEGCERWGVKGATEKLIGMFAFALWSEVEQKLYLVRDRLGKKPLYWGWQDDILFFGSQLKSFFKHPDWRGTIDYEALALYFQYNYVPTPYSIFKGIHKLPAGHILWLDGSGKSQTEAYWSLGEVIQKARIQPFHGSDEQAVNMLDQLLRDAVKRRMIADVPLGAFLSGGIDSSTIVALMQAQSTEPVRTFSIGFHEKEYDEAGHARAIAEFLGTHHTELYLPIHQAAELIPTIPEWCDEPFADSSQIPTYLVSQLAREQVVVSLSGDGGDELFAGYNRYHQGEVLWRTARLLPDRLRQKVADGILYFSPEFWDSVGKVIPPRWRPKNVGHKAHVFAEVLTCRRYEDYYHRCVSFWPQPEALVSHPLGPIRRFVDEIETHFLMSPIEKMQYWDMLTYLPDDILAKVDRASMAVSLEVRVPFLDHRVVAWSWSLPLSFKVRQGQGKWILRQVLDRYIPRTLMKRPKMGFGVPIELWLRHGLQEWAATLLDPKRLYEEGILNPMCITERLNQHLKGQRNWCYSLWGILMFQAWRQHWQSAISQP
jgi:asparagine synthase (glutamine-hydrolysing)